MQQTTQNILRQEQEEDEEEEFVQLKCTYNLFKKKNRKKIA